MIRQLSSPATRAALVAALVAWAASTSCSTSCAQDAPRNAMPEATIRINPAQDRGAISPFLYGSNHRYANNGTGMWDPQQKKSLPAFDRAHRRSGMKSIRFPGGTVGNTFEWKKSIGPVELRPAMQPFSGGGTPTGVFGKPAVATFGLDEAARWCEANGVEMIYMFGIAFSSPQDAADLIEYLNRPVGANHNGGTDWAAVRAANGHPAPYGVKYFEIANEADGPSQRYWWPSIDREETRAKKKLPFQQQRDSYAPEFLFGGVAKFEKQLVGTADGKGGRDFRDGQATGDGLAGQRKVLRYVPIEPGSDRVFVGEEEYTRVPDIKAATGNAYQIDSATGTILFGEGQKSTAPPAGSVISATYRAPRSGMTDFYRAMKAVDSTITIWAGYESPNIITTMGRRPEYDGVVIHPYTNQWNIPKATDMDDWHHSLMLSSARLGRDVREYQELIDKTVAPERKGKVRVITTEFGAIVQDRVLPDGAGAGAGKGGGATWRFLNVGLYTASQLLQFMRAGVPQAQRHATTVGVLGPAPAFEFTPTALAYQMFAEHFGPRLIGLEMKDVPQRETAKALVPGHGSPGKIIAASDPRRPAKAVNVTLPKLDAEASRDEAGNVFLMAVNQDARDDVAASIHIEGATNATAQVHTLNGASATAPRAQITPSQAQVQNGVLRHTFPAHSMTAIKIAAR